MIVNLNMQIKIKVKNATFINYKILKYKKKYNLFLIIYKKYI